MPTTGRHRGPPASPPRRPAVAPVVGILLVGACAAVIVGTAWAARGSPGLSGAGPDPAALAGSAARPAADRTWVPVVAALDARRAAAWASGSVPALSSVYSAGSPAGRRDSAALASYSAAGASVHGARPDVRTVSAVSPRGAAPDGPAARVVVAVTDSLPPGIVVDASGRAEVVAGRAVRAWRLTLVRSGGQWLLYDVTPA